MGGRGERFGMRSDLADYQRRTRAKQQIAVLSGPRPRHYLATGKILSRPLMRNKIHPAESLILPST